MNKKPLYSKKVKKLLISKLDNKEDFKKIDKKFNEFILDIPETGGSKNPQSRSIYDSIMLFAYYEVIDKKPNVKEFEKTVSELFVPKRKIFYGNLNNKLILRIGYLIVKHISYKSKKYNWKDNYKTMVPKFDKNIGIEYKFTYCPICDFAKKHGYLNLMPAMCNPDYPTIEMLNGKIIRTTTCATGDYCDYIITGDKNKIIKDHPEHIDSNGFIYNE